MYDSSLPSLSRIPDLPCYFLNDGDTKPIFAAIERHVACSKEQLDEWMRVKQAPTLPDPDFF